VLAEGAPIHHKRRVVRPPKGCEFILFEQKGMRGGMQVEQVGNDMHFRASKTWCAKLFRSAASHGYECPMKWFLDFMMGKPRAVIPADIMEKIRSALTVEEHGVTVVCRPRQKSAVLCQWTSKGIRVTVDAATHARLSLFAEMDKRPGGPAGAVIAALERAEGLPVTGGILTPPRAERERIARERAAKLERRAAA
jgi:hypothetical protein